MFTIYSILASVFNSFLCVIKYSNGSFFKENLSSIPVWYNTDIKVGMKTPFIKKNWYEIWSNLSLHIYHATFLRLGFNVVNILLGELPMFKNNKVINLITLCSKQYLLT